MGAGEGWGVRDRGVPHRAVWRLRAVVEGRRTWETTARFVAPSAAAVPRFACTPRARVCAGEAEEEGGRVVVGEGGGGGGWALLTALCSPGTHGAARPPFDAAHGGGALLCRRGVVAADPDRQRAAARAVECCDLGRDGHGVQLPTRERRHRRRRVGGGPLIESTRSHAKARPELRHAGRRERDLLQKVVDIRLRIDRGRAYRIRRLLRKHTVYIDGGGRAIEIICSRAAVSGAATATSSRSPSTRRGRGESLEGKLLHRKHLSVEVVAP